MSDSFITEAVWAVSSLLIGSCQIIAAILLLREKHIGPWLMIAGAVIGLLGVFIWPMMNWFLMSRANTDSTVIYYAVSGLIYFGAFVFAIGLLLHALRQKGRADRIAELEAILHSRHQND